MPYVSINIPMGFHMENRRNCRDVSSFLCFMLDSLWLLVMFSVATGGLEVGLGKHDGEKFLDHV